MTRPSRIFSLAVFIAALLLRPAPAVAQTPPVGGPAQFFGFKVDHGEGIIRGNAIALDSKNVYFAWYYLGDLLSGRPPEVMYESFPLVFGCQHVPCGFVPPIPTTVDVIGPLPSGANPGPFTGTLAYTIGVGVGPNGTPHIVYQDGNAGLRHAELCPCDDNLNIGWVTEQIPVPAGSRFTSMAVDKSGAVHVVSSSGSTISYIKKSNGMWGATESIFGPAALAGLQLALDSGGNPHVLWSDHRSNLNELVYANRGPGPLFWLSSNAEFVTNDWAEWISLAIDKNDQPAVAYWGGSCGNELSTAIIYVPREGGFWPPQVVDSFDFPSCFTNPPPLGYHNVSLAFSPAGLPRISYGYDHQVATGNSSGVALSVSDGLFFPKQAIDSDPIGALNSTSLIVDAADVSHVLFMVFNCPPGAGSCDNTLYYQRRSNANTPAGNSVTVDLSDPATYGPTITVTYSQVTQAGLTSVSIVNPNDGPAPPANFELGDPPVYFDFSTTATFVPPVKVCIPYSSVTPTSAALMHYENGAWVNRTVSNNIQSEIICADVDSFSPFAVFQSSAPPPPTDTVPPVTVASASPLANAAGWNNSNITIALNSTDNEANGSGVKQITYSATGAQTISSTVVSSASAALTISVEGTTTITFFGTDNSGNVESPKTLTVMLDKTPPTITPVRTPQPNSSGWNNTNVTVSFLCTDGLSGLAAGSPPAPTTLSSEGAGQSVSGSCTDIAGNVASATVSGINIDKTPPIVACTASPNILWPPNNKLVPVNASATVSDALSGSGGFTLVSVTSNEPDSGQGDIQGFVTGTASTAGFLRAQRLGSGTGRIYTLTYSGSDAAGNTASCTTTVLVPHDQGN